MNHLPFGKRARRERGAAAVELALILPVVVLFLMVPLFFARYFMHYSVAQKAARDAARYLSSVPTAEMLTTTSPIGEIEAAKLAKSLGYMETAELSPGPGGIFIEAQCDGLTCLGKAIPSTVRVTVTIQFSDTVFPEFTTDYSATPLWIVGDVSMPYARQ